MKKTITSILLLAMFSFTAVFSQTTKQYAVDDIATLADDLKDAGDGDIFELTTSGGMYVLTDYLGIFADVTIRAAADLAVKPILKRNSTSSEDYLIRLKADSVDLILQGIELQGDTVSTKYAIRTAKIGDIDNAIDYEDCVTNGKIEQTYSLVIDNCDINGIKSGSDGRGIIMYPGTLATLVKITNTTFSAIERDAINAYISSSEKAIGYWKFVDSMVIENTTFHTVGRDAITFVTGNDDVAKSNKLMIDHCTFDSVGWNNSDPGKYHSLEIDYVNATITNTVFTKDVSDDYIVILKHPEASADFIGVYNLGTVEDGDTISTSNGATLGSNLFSGDPLYADDLNGDYTLGIGSAFTGMASDGSALGDLRWDMAEARLMDLTVDGESVVGFDAEVKEYFVKLAYGTTDIPVVAGDAKDAAAAVTPTQATVLPGDATVVVVAADKVTTLTYTIHFSIAPSNDASLSNLTVDGTTIPGFNTDSLVYTYPLVYGTTDIPEVLGTITDSEASSVETQATTLPGAATIVVTAKDEVTMLTYTVNFTILPDTDASLSMLTVNGDSIVDFAADVLTYDVELPKGTVEIPLTIATTMSPVATFTMVTTTELPGSTLVNVTAEDEETMLTYTVNFTVTPYSDDASLSDIKIDGESLTDFDDSTLEYTVELDHGTTEIPTVEGMVANEFAMAVNNQATELPGDATIVVTAEDSSMLTYTVHFTIAAPPTYAVTFTVVDEAANLLEGAVITFNGIDMTTDAEGMAVFAEVAMVTDAAYSVAMGDDYMVHEGTVSVIDMDVEVPVTLIHVGISELSLVVGDVYPNPTMGKVHFTLSDQVVDATLIVTDMNGKVIENRDLSEVETTIDLSGNTQGIYFVNIISGDNNYMTKVILK